jgi:MFS transporter, OPA family, solute carrier family 37 (glycerol-3-phosphate transporter), member 1/2
MRVSLCLSTNANDLRTISVLFIDQPNYQGLFGTLDYAYLFAYAIGMFISGHIAERMHLRTFLTGSMFLCALTTCAFGAGYYWEVHSLGYFIAVQIVAGLAQSTGWPAVCAAVANWVGKGKRGFVTGAWNSHTFVGNILRSLIAGALVIDDWGLSFIVPGIIIGCAGVIVFLFLVPSALCPSHFVEQCARIIESIV